MSTPSARPAAPPALSELIRREMMADFSDKLSMEEISTCAYRIAENYLSTPLPPPQARTPDNEEVCKTCGRPTKITITSQGIYVGSCPDCEQPFVNYGSPAALKPTTCMLCNWEWDQEKNTHIPEIMESISGVYVCGECNTRCKTVDSFGLTVEELRIAARNHKARAASAPQEAGRLYDLERQMEFIHKALGRNTAIEPADRIYQLRAERDRFEHLYRDFSLEVERLRAERGLPVEETKK